MQAPPPGEDRRPVERHLRPGHRRLDVDRPARPHLRPTSGPRPRPTRRTPSPGTVTPTPRRRRPTVLTAPPVGDLDGSTATPPRPRHAAPCRRRRPGRFASRSLDARSATLGAIADLTPAPRTWPQQRRLGDPDPAPSVTTDGSRGIVGIATEPPRSGEGGSRLIGPGRYLGAHAYRRPVRRAREPDRVRCRAGRHRRPRDHHDRQPRRRRREGSARSAAVARTRERCALTVRGNWDDFLPVSAEHHDPAIRWWHEELTADDRTWLSTLPLSHDLQIAGRNVRLFHASATSVYTRVHFHHTDEEFAAMFATTELTGDGPEPTVVLYGDVHDAYVETYRGRTLVNVGSVGNPLDETTASYVILDDDRDTFSVQIVRVPYDMEAEIAVARRPSGCRSWRRTRSSCGPAIYRGQHAELGLTPPR